MEFHFCENIQYILYTTKTVFTLHFGNTVLQKSNFSEELNIVN